MALPKVQEQDIIEVAFHNHDKMYRDGGVIYASAKRNDESEVDMMSGSGFLLVGGEAKVKSVDRSSITLGARLNDCGDELDECDIEYIRIERKFIKSLNVEYRFTVVDFGDEDIQVRIPEDASENIEILESGDVGDEFGPKTIKEFLGEVKKRYYDTRLKAKPKKKKKPDTLKKGTKITEANWQHGMTVDINAIPWLDAADDLNAVDLHFVWNEGYFNTNMKFTWNGLEVYDPTTYSWKTITAKLVHSTTLSKAFKPAEAEHDPEDELDHAEFGNMVCEKEIGYQCMTFYDRGVEIGCKSFSATEVKKLYKALCKVYGDPK